MSFLPFVVRVEWIQAVIGGPTVTVKPVSSRTSRINVSSRPSPVSTPPPGRSHSPGTSSKSSLRCSRRIRPSRKMAPFTPAPARRYRVIGIGQGHSPAEISFAETLARDGPKAAQLLTVHPGLSSGPPEPDGTKHDREADDPPEQHAEGCRDSHGQRHENDQENPQSACGGGRSWRRAHRGHRSQDDVNPRSRKALARDGPKTAHFRFTGPLLQLRSRVRALSPRLEEKVAVGTANQVTWPQPEVAGHFLSLPLETRKVGSPSHALDFNEVA